MLNKDFIPNDEIYNKNIIFYDDKIYKTPENVLNYIKENEDKMNNKFDFTEGKWEYEYDNDIDCNDDNFWAFYRIKSKDFSICQVDSESNARLISCAPEMLNALIEDCLAYGNKMSEEDFEFLKNQPVNINTPLTRFIKKILLIEKATGKKWSEII